MSRKFNAIKPIKSESDYRETLARIDKLMDAEKKTPEADELEVLATLAELYEKATFPIDRPDRTTAIIEELVSALDDLIKPERESWVIENAQTALARARRHLKSKPIIKFECRTCGAQSTMDPPDCPRGAVHCDIIEEETPPACRLGP